MLRAVAIVLLVVALIVSSAWAVWLDTTIRSRAQPTNRIHKLSLRITTEDRRGAGTDNAVYFDVGPVSWRLNTPRHNDFERGHTEEFDLTPELPCVFTRDDILWLRLQKKGILGYNGTGDGLDGAWHPQTLTLIVNGVALEPETITEPLNSTCWFWRKPLVFGPSDPYTSAANFVRTLRLKPNSKVGPFGRAVGFVTTPLKNAGLSGWLTRPECKECMNSAPADTCSAVQQRLCATGVVYNRVKSTDGLATIDLNVSRIEFCRKGDDCYDSARVKDVESLSRARFLRIEYRHRGYIVPVVGEKIRLCGQLLWDTDDEGWWEIHPTDCHDVTFPLSFRDGCLKTKK